MNQEEINAKARELVEKYMTPIDPLHQYPMCFDTSKQCALIACDEMLSLGGLVGGNLSDIFYIYWKQVKQAIENL